MFIRIGGVYRCILYGLEHYDHKCNSYKIFLLGNIENIAKKGMVGGLDHLITFVWNWYTVFGITCFRQKYPCVSKLIHNELFQKYFFLQPRAMTKLLIVKRTFVAAKIGEVLGSITCKNIVEKPVISVKKIQLEDPNGVFIPSPLYILNKLVLFFCCCFFF